MKPGARSRPGLPDDIDGGGGEQYSADAIVIAGSDVIEVDKPIIERAKSSVRNAGAAIDDRGVRLPICGAGSQMTSASIPQAAAKETISNGHSAARTALQPPRISVN